MTAPGRGRLWVISAPSGAGKTTLVRALMKQHPLLRFSVSYTTRPMRLGERHGEDYFFVDAAGFEAMVGAGAFLEHASVFGRRYGTARAQVESLLAEGCDVLLEIDWQGARQVRSRMPDCHSVFILPPSLAVLEQRLRGRGTDEEAVIQRRLAEAREDLGHWNEFDYVIVNDDLGTALRSLQDILEGRGTPAATSNPAQAARARQVVGG
jgi:guanylate kinase